MGKSRNRSRSKSPREHHHKKKKRSSSREEIWRKIYRLQQKYEKKRRLSRDRRYGRHQLDRHERYPRDTSSCDWSDMESHRSSRSRTPPQQNKRRQPEKTSAGRSSYRSTSVCGSTAIAEQDRISKNRRSGELTDHSSGSRSRGTSLSSDHSSGASVSCSERPRCVTLVRSESKSRLDNATLKLLGDDPSKNIVAGPKIHEVLVDRWAEMVKRGLSSEVKEDIIKKYPAPENFQIIKPPIINAEVKSTMSDIANKKDKFQSASQEQLGASFSAIGKALTLICDWEDDGHNKSELVEYLSDAARLLADSHYHVSKTRRAFITPNLNRIVKNITDDLSIDKYLYGEDFAEKLKAAKAVEQQGKDLAKGPVSSNSVNYKKKSWDQQRKTSNYKGYPRMNTQTNPLNSKGPSRKPYNNFHQGGRKNHHSQAPARRR